MENESDKDSDQTEINEDEILRLWKDISFPGSFRGLKTFQAVLKTDKNIDISEKKLLQIFRKEPLYLIHQIKPRKKETRPVITHNYGEIVQADLAYMFEDVPTKSKYFLLLVDVYSQKIFVEIIDNKESQTVASALENIFKRFGAPIYQLQTDRGKEFTGRPCKVLYEKLHIRFSTKRGLSKASFAEAAIFRVKRKLYIFLRANLSKHWTEYIQKVVESLNNIPLKRLGYLRPNDITDITSSVLVDNKLKENGLPIPKEPTYNEQRLSQINYENRANENNDMIKAGDYVYLKIKEDIFGKSFDIQVLLKLLTQIYLFRSFEVFMHKISMFLSK